MPISALFAYSVRPPYRNIFGLFRLVGILGTGRFFGAVNFEIIPNGDNLTGHPRTSIQSVSQPHMVHALVNRGLRFEEGTLEVGHVVIFTVMVRYRAWLSQWGDFADVGKASLDQC